MIIGPPPKFHGTRDILLPLSRSREDAVEHILAGFADLPVHPDVPDGIRALGGMGIRLVP
jgi:2-haloacid dehalogenase